MRRSARIRKKQEPALAPTNKMLRQLRWQLEHEKKIKERKQKKLEAINAKIVAMEEKLKENQEEFQKVCKQLDDKESAKRQINCQICEEVYSSDSDHFPLILGCGHTLCTGCFAKVCQASDRNPRCPLDRTVIPVPFNYEWMFINHDVLRFNASRHFTPASLDF